MAHHHHRLSLSTLLPSLLLLIDINNAVVQASENHYCGANWLAAYQSCTTPCPSMLDSECPTGQECFGYTGCAVKLAAGSYSPTLFPTASESPRPTFTPTATTPPVEPGATTTTFLCDAPASGCRNGMFNQVRCVCECIPPFCPDVNGDCTNPTNSCGGNPWVDCARGMDCPWWVNPLKAESCTTGPSVPTGLWSIYNTEEACCNSNFPYSNTCTANINIIVVSTPTKQPTLTTAVDDAMEVIPIRMQVRCAPDDNIATDGMLTMLKRILLRLSDSISGLKISSVEESNGIFPGNGAGLVTLYYNVVVVRDEDKEFGLLIIDGVRDSYDEVLSQIDSFADLTYCAEDSNLDLDLCTSERAAFTYCVKQSAETQAPVPSFGFKVPSLKPTSMKSGLSESDEYYCGLDWPDASTFCAKPCPNGRDDECSSLGESYECFYFTGCAAKVVDVNDISESEGGANNGVSGPVNNNFCGQSWTDAMLRCSNACPNGYECPVNEQCFAATNCDRPLEQLVSELVITIHGPDNLMNAIEQMQFRETMSDFVQDVLDENGIALNGVVLDEQSLVEISPSGGSNAIDISIVVTGDYRPPPYWDLSAILSDDINRYERKLISLLESGSDYFLKVERIESSIESGTTQRPTTEPPTMSLVPTHDSPPISSTLPMRPFSQALDTGSRQDLQLGGLTTSSYGLLFNIRTKPNSGAVNLTGLDFYTESTEDVTYEIWTRLGSFKDFKGTYEGWQLIASGTTKGRGIGRYTAVREEHLIPVSIPGGGGEDGTRAIYLTLTSINLVYKLGDPGSVSSDEKAHAETEDIEIWEGEGVLFYPMPDAKDTFYYRMPRQFLGVIYYNQLPCGPFSSGNEPPCPETPIGSPTSPSSTESQEEANERDALITFYGDTKGELWKRQDSWVSDLDVCTWYGVGCTGSRVSELRLPSNNLEGRIFSSMFTNLSQLEAIDLSDNNLSSEYFLPFPTALQELNLASNVITSIEFCGGCNPNLRYLDLSNNGIIGSIHTQLFQFPKLETILLGQNYLTGYLLTNDDLSQLVNLRVLDLGDNKLSGTLISFTEATGLHSLNISSNSISGTIPEDFMKSSFNNPIYFDYSLGEPRYGIPHNIDVSFNQLEGSVPNFDILELDLNVSGNMLTALDPGICDRRSWNQRGIAQFGCDSVACPLATWNEQGRQSSGLNPCTPCPDAIYIGSVSCEAGAGVGQPPAISCTDTPDYSDVWGGRCEDYRDSANYPNWCHGYGGTGVSGMTPNENCCVCKELLQQQNNPPPKDQQVSLEPTENPPSSPTLSPSSRNPVALDTPLQSPTPQPTKATLAPQVTKNPTNAVSESPTESPPFSSSSPVVSPLNMSDTPPDSPTLQPTKVTLAPQITENATVTDSPSEAPSESPTFFSVTSEGCTSVDLHLAISIIFGCTFLLFDFV